MGDFITVESLSAWDMDKRLPMEGRRYKDDIAVGNEALDRMLTPMLERSPVGYRPELVYLGGNHEYRVDRYIEYRPEMEGHLDWVGGLRLEERGFTTYPYRESYTAEGVYFSHITMNGANQAPGGKYAIYRVLDLAAHSTVFAHTHRWEMCNFYRHGADDILQMLSCGAFFEHTDTYAKGASNHYWRGVAMLHHFANGRFDVEQWSIPRLRSAYEVRTT
jgi:hypothetical protein